MNSKSTGPIPKAITQLERQLGQFRSTRPGPSVTHRGGDPAPRTGIRRAPSREQYAVR